MTAPAPSRRTALAASLCALLALAARVGGNIARDGVLLSRCDPSALPVLLAIGAVLSIAAAFGVGRLMSRFSPGRVVPLLGVASAALLVVEWLADGAAPRAAAVAVYIHLAVLGPILVSGFWSVVNERFDPRAARRTFGLIGAGASVGGLVGGLLVERLSVHPSRVIAILPVIAALQLLHAWRVHALAAGETRAPAQRVPAGAALQVLRGSPQLRRLALLVFVAAVAAAALDFVFKSRAVAAHASADLIHYFALFYTACAVATALLQTIAGRALVEKLGPALSLGTLPGAVVAVAGAAVMFPGLGVVARGVEILVRSSVFRPGYELFFAPLPAPEKRATKTMIDVGAERAGDVAGALLIALLLAAGSSGLLLAFAAALGALALVVVWRLHVGQRAALALSLRARTPVGEGLTAMLSRLSLRSPILLRAAPAHAPAAPPIDLQAQIDPIPRAIAALRSGDPARAAEALRMAPLSPSLVADALPLLGSDALAAPAAAALAAVALRITGQLVDRLLDGDEELAIRRRIPPLLEHAAGPLAAWGLARGLSDARFEVRYRCGRALYRLKKRDPALGLDAEALLDAVRQELRGAAWERAGALAADGEPDEPDAPARALGHVFRLLVLALGDESLALAFRGASATDAHLRGTALEYLEGALPSDIRDALWPFVENDDQPRRQRGSA